MCISIWAARLTLTGIDQLWVADLTYIRLCEQFVYLAVILDAFSRRVLGWALNDSLHLELPLAALRKALELRHPAPGLVHHSDRGVQYAAKEYLALLLAHGIAPSMSRAGNPYDNAQCESFMKTLKQEEIYTRQYRDRADLEQHIVEFLEQYYNRQCLHSALNYCSPEQFEQSLLEKPTALPAASLSFLRHEETIVPIAGIQSREQQRSIRHHSRCHRCDESPAEYSSASCSPVELASASSASLMLNQQPSLVQHNAANGNRGMSLLSHQGSPQFPSLTEKGSTAGSENPACL